MSSACHLFGAAGEGRTRISPSSLCLREWKCIFPHKDVYLHVLGEPSAQFTFPHAPQAAEQLLHPWGAQTAGTWSEDHCQPLFRGQMRGPAPLPCQELLTPMQGLQGQENRTKVSSAEQLSTGALRKESLHTGGFAALPASGPSSQEKKGKLRAINTVNVSIKFFWELQMLLSTGKLRGKRGKGHFASLKQSLTYWVTKISPSEKSLPLTTSRYRICR